MGRRFGLVDGRARPTKLSRRSQRVAWQEAPCSTVVLVLQYYCTSTTSAADLLVRTLSTIVPFLMYSNTPADEYWISQQNFTFLQYIRSISESDGSHPRLIPHHFLVLRT
eukprot:COSAG02_NODE_17003_length_1036_cov_4.771612_1_plen_109_part_10